MAGFNKIKRKISRQVVGGGSVVIFEDLNPFEVKYQKFYENEDMFFFSNDIFRSFKDKYPEGTYILEIDTLGVYMNSKVTYQIKRVITALAIKDDLGVLEEGSFDIEEREINGIRCFSLQ